MDDCVGKISNLFNDITGWVVAEILLSFVIVWVFIKVTQTALPWLATHLSSRLRHATLNVVPILRVLALGVLVVWVIPLVFNVSLQNFVFVAGALSVAVGFAVKDLARSMIAGFVALFEKPYRLGDWIRIGEDYGEVVSIGTRSVQLRTPEDNVVTIPHDRIWTENISNANDGIGTLMCVAKFYVARDQATGEVATLLDAVARTSPYLNLDRKVIVVSHNEPFAVVYHLKAYPFEPRNQFAFIADMTERGNAALFDAGILCPAVLFDAASRTHNKNEPAGR